VKPQPVLVRIPRGQLMHVVRLQPTWTHAVALFTDDQWRPATVQAWCRLQGSWAALIEWADGTQDWRAYDARCLREAH
jgi:hypothetical protein